MGTNSSAKNGYRPRHSRNQQSTILYAPAFIVRDIIAEYPHLAAALRGYLAAATGTAPPEYARFPESLPLSIRFIESLPTDPNRALDAIPNPYRGHIKNIFLTVARRGESCRFFAVKNVSRHLHRLLAYQHRRGNVAGIAAYALAIAIFCPDDGETLERGYRLAAWAIANYGGGAKH